MQHNIFSVCSDHPREHIKTSDGKILGRGQHASFQTTSSNKLAFEMCLLPLLLHLKEVVQPLIPAMGIQDLDTEEFLGDYIAIWFCNLCLTFHKQTVCILKATFKMQFCWEPLELQLQQETFVSPLGPAIFKQSSLGTREEEGEGNKLNVIAPNILAMKKQVQYHWASCVMGFANIWTSEKLYMILVFIFLKHVLVLPNIICHANI